ncbi:MAG: flagellar type III secretion system pore protein FliP [Bradymonadia bacterium]
MAAVDSPGALLVLAALGLVVPVLAVVATAFTRVLVVLGLLRSGLGVPDALPAPVLGALAAVLTAVLMWPTAMEVNAAVMETPGGLSDTGAVLQRAWPPLERFLDAHTREADRALIVEVARTLDPAAQVTPLPPPHRVAAFALSELTAAFRMGVLLLLPFLVVDLLVANTLVALGLGLLSPALIALPFKLVLFLAADGFPMLLRGFARAYA